MITVGSTLKKNRELRKVSINKVSEELKISKEILSRIENDEIVKNTDIVFYIGHLRSYSNFLDLDTQNIVKKFKEELSYSKEVLARNISKPAFTENKSNFVKIFSGSLILTIFISFYYLFVNEKSGEKQYALVPEVPDIYVPVIEKAEINLLNNQNQEINKKNISSANASNLVSVNEFSNKFITLKFLNSTWVQIRDKSDNIILSQLMEKDEEYSYGSNLGYNITAGNAGNILVLIDDDVRGKLGKYGEILDSYVLDSKFNN